MLFSHFFLWTLFLSVVKAERTVIIGDSMYWSGMLFFGGQPSPLAKYLETWSGHAIENHALVGASLEEGWVKSIRSQYNDLNKQPVITTLIMDGGGNDVISHRSDCTAFNNKCVQMIDHSAGIAASILADAHIDGVSNVLYLGFYYLDGLMEAADYADPLIDVICRNATVNCHFVDPRANITSAMIGSDGLHPTEEGYKVLAELIWDVKLDYNIPV